MAIIKTLACAVLFLVQVTNADFYLHCMGSPSPNDANPDSACGDISGEVFSMMSDCTASTITDATMGDVFPASRRLGGTRRELQDPDNGCYGTNLSGGYQMMCCMQTDDKYSYCGSPTTDDRRQLQITTNLVDGICEQGALSTIATDCTTAFKALATGYDNATHIHCFGPPAVVFCRTIDIFLG
jgi:hypothetical protein